MKSDVSPIFLTYHMVDWKKVQHDESDQTCQTCGGPLKRTEEVVDERGNRYEADVWPRDWQVAWVRPGKRD